MDLTWLALSVGALAMLVVAYLAWSIGKQDASTLQPNATAGSAEIDCKTFGKLQRRTERTKFSMEHCCARRLTAL